MGAEGEATHPAKSVVTHYPCGRARDTMDLGAPLHWYPAPQERP